jgi:hypothetical protein
VTLKGLFRDPVFSHWNILSAARGLPGEMKAMKSDQTPVQANFL